MLSDEDVGALVVEAQAGSADACRALGDDARWNAGTPDLVAAHMWYNLAGMLGSEEARSERIEVAGLMATEAIAEAQRRARQWLTALPMRIS
jgi:TPR repeat protein